MRRQRGTLRDVRRNNRSVLLRTLYFSGELSRYELAELTGLSPATVSNVVSDLMADEVVLEAGAVDSDGGRPRILLKVNPRRGCAVGVDVGETRVRLELFDLTMAELAKSEHMLELEAHSPETVVGHIRDGLGALLTEAGVAEERLLGIGVGVPGMVERGAEPLIQAPTFGWHDVPLARMLAEVSPLPVLIDNGAKALGQAESWFGAGRGASHLITVLVGTGIGASIIDDGTTFRGHAGGAGELGHMSMALNGRRCRCGGRGCLEAYAGAEAILATAGHDWSGTDEEGAFTSLLSEPTARPAFEEAVRYLGAGLGNMINLFNPERIVIGGWAGLLLGRAFLPELRAAAEAAALPRPFAQTSIELGQLGAEAVSRGAAILVVDRFLAGHIS